MLELMATNDPVVLSLAQSLLEEAGIAVLVADAHMSVLEGSIGVFPRRVLVPRSQHDEAQAVARGGRARRLAGGVMTAAPGATTIDDFLGGRLRVEQPARGFRAGLDAVLLAAALTPASLTPAPGRRLGCSMPALASALPDCA